MTYEDGVGELTAKLLKLGKGRRKTFEPGLFNALDAVRSERVSERA
jgi:hypothetical protein